MPSEERSRLPTSGRSALEIDAVQELDRGAQRNLLLVPRSHRVERNPHSNIYPGIMSWLSYADDRARRLWEVLSAQPDVQEGGNEHFRAWMIS